VAKAAAKTLVSRKILTGFSERYLHRSHIPLPRLVAGPCV
jgi:hypothetical protein